MDTQAQLKAFGKTCDFFVGVDSDGCAFDTMELKQKECFVPQTIHHYDLQGVCRWVRETEEWVNLYSRWRGSNRFPALVRVFDLLARRPQCLARGYHTPEIDSLRRWIDEEPYLGNHTLEAEVERTGDAALAKALAWSLDVNVAVEKIARNIPLFAHVRESLQKLQGVADVMVVSATPLEALEREWREHNLDGLVGMICGQELGSKAEQLQYGAVGKYDADRILMVGDALGDLRSARAHGVRFYPIEPGDEETCWLRFRDEAIDRFLAGEYKGDYEDELIARFEARLPEVPPWEVV